MTAAARLKRVLLVLGTLAVLVSPVIAIILIAAAGH